MGVGRPCCGRRFRNCGFGLGCPFPKSISLPEHKVPTHTHLLVHHRLGPLSPGVERRRHTLRFVLVLQWVRESRRLWTSHIVGRRPLVRMPSLRHRVVSMRRSPHVVALEGLGVPMVRIVGCLVRLEFLRIVHVLGIGGWAAIVLVSRGVGSRALTVWSKSLVRRFILLGSVVSSRRHGGFSGF